MCALAPDFYPVQLHEARYQGVYEGGPWLLIAGLRNPRRECAAFASDIPCLQFWQRVQEDGPVITLDNEQEIFAAADGDRPAYSMSSWHSSSQLTRPGSVDYHRPTGLHWVKND